MATDIEQLALDDHDFKQFSLASDDFGWSILANTQIHLLALLLVLLLAPLSMVISRAKRSYHLFQKQTGTEGIQTQLIEESFEFSLDQYPIFLMLRKSLSKGCVVMSHYAGYSQSTIFYS